MIDLYTIHLVYTVTKLLILFKKSISLGRGKERQREREREGQKIFFYKILKFITICH